MSYCLQAKNHRGERLTLRLTNPCLRQILFLFSFFSLQLFAGSFSSRCELLWESISGQNSLRHAEERLEEIPSAELIQTALEIQREFPIQNHFFLDIGRSPFPVTRSMEILLGADVGTLPLSYHSRPQGVGKIFMPWLAEKKLSFYTMEAQQESLFFLFLQQWMPVDQIQGKDIVLVDFAESGDSLLKAYKDITSFFHQKGISKRVHLLMLTSNSPWLASSPSKDSEKNRDILYLMVTRVMQQRGDRRLIFNLEETANTLGEALNDSALKPLAPFQNSFFIQKGRASADPRSNPDFERFLVLLKEKIK